MGLESYYSTASFGQVSVHVTLFPSWIRLPHTMGYYGNDSKVGDDAAGNPNGSEQLIVDAVAQATSTEDLRKYSYLIVVHAGEDQATADPSSRSSLIWSRTWVGQRFLSNGTDTGSIVSETSPVGIWAHEFGHNIGQLPDMYDTSDPRFHYDGVWSLMDLGPFLGTPEGSQPALLDAWSRVTLGWITPTIIRNGDFNVIPAEVPPSGAQVTCCYALEIPIDGSSYYLVELRLKQGLDSAQRSAGVIIYLYNSSGLAKPRVIDIRHTTPFAGNLFDAALSPGERFVDVQHQISITVVSGSSAYYSIRIASAVSYTVSLTVPQTVTVLTSEGFSVLLDPPSPGLRLRIFLDGSPNPLKNLTTTSSSLYNFSLYLEPSQQGAHNLTAVLTDATGNILASASAKLTANVPLWVTLDEPVALYAFGVAGIVLIVVFGLIAVRKRSRVGSVSSGENQ